MKKFQEEEKKINSNNNMIIKNLKSVMGSQELEEYG